MNLNEEATTPGPKVPQEPIGYPVPPHDPVPGDKGDKGDKGHKGEKGDKG